MTATIKTTNLQHASSGSANIVLGSDGTSDVVGNFQRGHIAGLTLSYSNTTTFGVAVGSATASDGTTSMTLSSAYTKTTGSWAVGTGNGGLDTGSVTTSTWYHVYLIKRSDTGVVDILISTSATSPTMPTNYDLKRRIGAIKTDGSSQIIDFTQVGDEFLWDVQVEDVDTSSLSTTAQLYTLSVPTGVTVWAIIDSTTQSATVDCHTYLSSPDVSDQSASAGDARIHMVIQSANHSDAGMFMIRTDTSARVRAVSTHASTTFRIGTHGWRDRRGRDD